MIIFLFSFFEEITEIAHKGFLEFVHLHLDKQVTIGFLPLFL